MATAYPFLDILANDQVRDAYLAGRVTLILSSDLETVLWANGTGARFLGFHTVAESLHAVGGFSAFSRRTIENAIHSGAAVSVPGVEGSRDFFANRLFIEPLGEIVFLRSSAACRQNGFFDLTEGLSDETSEAALIDISGRLMFADKGFNKEILNEPALPQLLAEANHDGLVKKRLLGVRRPYPVGLLRLNQKPPVFLLIAAKNRKPSPADSMQTFVFNPQLLPTRFVWQSDASGIITEISPELEEIVGPLYAAIVGKRFVDFAKAWQMDKDGAVRTLLQSGNPWSEQKLNWPVEGGKHRVEVVLSGLPIYSADKQFMGFRGFGLIEKVVDIMREDKAGYNDHDGRNLSHQEQEAFEAIAERLRRGLLPQEVVAAAAKDREIKSLSENIEVLSEGENISDPGQTTENDIFAELAGSVQAETEAAVKKEERLIEDANPETGDAAEFVKNKVYQNTEAVEPDFAGQAEQIRRLEAEISSLHYQKDKLNFLLNATTEAILVFNKSCHILSANMAAARLFDYDLDNLIGKTVDLLFVPAAIEALYQDIHAAEAEKTDSFLKASRGTEGCTRKGAKVRLRLNFGCLEQGESYFLLIRDMTRFHDIIASLLRKNNEETALYHRQSRYLALVSHEIRTPMNAVLGMAQFMAEEKAGPLNNDKYKEYLRDMVNAGAHIMTLVNDILQIAQKKADWLKMDIQPLLLSHVLNEVSALMMPQANAANIIMRSGIAADLPPVLADARAVKQILLNLIGNAVHFTPEGGQIVIAAHELKDSAEPDNAKEVTLREGTAENRDNPAGRRILVRISDTGIGMSEAEITYSLRDLLANIEERENPAAVAKQQSPTDTSGDAENDLPLTDKMADFEQEGDKTVFALKTRMKGAGLGLPMVRTLAAANNIRFSLNSEPGKGTIAALVFPVAEQEKPKR